MSSPNWFCYKKRSLTSPYDLAPVYTQVPPVAIVRIKVVQLQGWRAVAQGGAEKGGTLWSDTTKTTDDCLEKCRQSWMCRFVTFDLNRKVCYGLGWDAATRFQRDPSYSVLTDSVKYFIKKNATTIPGGDIMVGSERAADDTWDDTICVILCHIHPRCNAVDYDQVTGWCRLKEKFALRPAFSSDHISHIS